MTNKVRVVRTSQLCTSLGLDNHPQYNPYHPWDWCIYLHEYHEWLILMVKNVGKYTFPWILLGCIHPPKINIELKNGPLDRAVLLSNDPALYL